MDGRKGRVVCRQHCKWWFKDIDEIRVLIGVVYMTKKYRGQELSLVCREERLLLHLIRKQREDRIGPKPVESSVLNAEPRWQTGKILWSMVSKAADRSRRQRHELWREPIALGLIIRWSYYNSRAVSVHSLRGSTNTWDFVCPLSDIKYVTVSFHETKAFIFAHGLRLLSSVFWVFWNFNCTSDTIFYILMMSKRRQTTCWNKRSTAMGIFLLAGIN